MKEVKGHFHEQAVAFDAPYDSVCIRTDFGDFRITRSSNHGIEVNFAGVLSKTGIAVLPACSNVVKLEPTSLY